MALPVPKPLIRRCYTVRLVVSMQCKDTHERDEDTSEKSKTDTDDMSYMSARDYEIHRLFFTAALRARALLPLHCEYNLGFPRRSNRFQQRQTPATRWRVVPQC